MSLTIQTLDRELAIFSGSKIFDPFHCLWGNTVIISTSYLLSLCSPKVTPSSEKRAEY